MHQQSLTRVLGFPVTDSEAVADAVDLVAKLQRWQAGGTSPNPAVSGLAEFGADLEVRRGSLRMLVVALAAVQQSAGW